MHWATAMFPCRSVLPFFKNSVSNVSFPTICRLNYELTETIYSILFRVMNDAMTICWRDYGSSPSSHHPTTTDIAQNSTATRDLHHRDTCPFCSFPFFDLSAQPKDHSRRAKESCIDPLNTCLPQTKSTLQTEWRHKKVKSHPYSSCLCNANRWCQRDLFRETSINLLREASYGFISTPPDKSNSEIWIAGHNFFLTLRIKIYVMIYKRT